jgi:hypothetical protein
VEPLPACKKNIEWGEGNNRNFTSREKMFGANQITGQVGVSNKTFYLDFIGKSNFCQILQIDSTK